MAKHPQLPRFTQGEQAILAGMLMDSRAVVKALASLKTDDFWHEAHRLIFSAMRRLSESGQPIDWVTVSNKLKKLNTFETIGGPVFLAKLADALPSAANIQHYIDAVKNASQLRGLYDQAIKVAEATLKDQASAEELISMFQNAAFQAGRGGINEQNRLRKLSELLPDAIREMEEAKGWGIRSGLKDFDTLTRGFFPGDLIFIAARPSMGKTALAADIMFEAIAEKEPAALFSLEMRGLDICKRVISKRARVNLQRVRSGSIHLTQADWDRVIQFSGEADKLPIFICDEKYLTVSKMRARLQEMEIRYGRRAKLAIVDYLQFMRPEGKFENQNLAVSSMTFGLKVLAQQMNIPIIVLSQLNRDCEKRTDKRPILSDLRDSGSIEQDADIIVFIYRAERYKPDDLELQGKAELIVAKQRNGPIGTAHVHWKAETASFLNELPDGVAEPYMERM